MATPWCRAKAVALPRLVEILAHGCRVRHLPGPCIPTAPPSPRESQRRSGAHLPLDRPHCGGDRRLVAMLKPYDTLGSTEWVDFDTSKPVRQTDPDKCHVNYTVADSRWDTFWTSHRRDSGGSALREEPGPQLRDPYSLDGQPKAYYPDFLVDLDDAGALTTRCTSSSRCPESETGRSRSRWTLLARSGFLPSTTPNASDDGASSKSPIPTKDGHHPFILLSPQMQDYLMPPRKATAPKQVKSTVHSTNGRTSRQRNSETSLRR